MLRGAVAAVLAALVLGGVAPTSADAAQAVTPPDSVVWSFTSPYSSFPDAWLDVAVYVADSATEVDHVELATVDGTVVPDHASLAPTALTVLAWTVSDRPGFRRAFGHTRRAWDADRTLVAWSLTAAADVSTPATALVPRVHEVAPPTGPTTTVGTGWTFDASGRKLTVYEHDTAGVRPVYAEVRTGWDNPATALYAGRPVDWWAPPAPATWWEFVSLPDNVMNGPTGTHITVTLVTTDASQMTWTRRYVNVVLGVPEDSDVRVAGPARPPVGSRPRYDIRVLTSNWPVPTAPVTVQTRTATGPWVSRATVTTDSVGAASWTSPPLTEGIAVRAVVPSVVPSVSPTVVSVHRRAIVSRLSTSSTRAGWRVVLSGTVTGSRYGTAVTVWRCASLTSRCTAYSVTRTYSGGVFRALVRAPARRGAVVWYRASVSALSAWTPAAYGARLRLRSA